MALTRYMVLLYGGTEQIEKMSPSEIQAYIQRWNEWMDKLENEGIGERGAPLEREARVIRGRRKLVSDGPYIEAKEAIGGYVVIKAQSIEEAADIARECPLLEVDGIIEIRPIQTVLR